MSYKIILLPPESIRSLYDLGFTEAEAIDFCKGLSSEYNVEISQLGAYIEFESQTVALAWRLFSKKNVPIYRFNHELNGLEIFFRDKPDEEILSHLEQKGWRWSNYKKCWYSKKNSLNLDFVRKLCYIDNGKRAAEEILTEEQAFLEAEETQRKTYLERIKQAGSYWDGHYEDYPSFRLAPIYSRCVAERNKKLLSSVPEKLLKHLNYYDSCESDLSLDQIYNLKIIGREYTKQIDEISLRMAEQAEYQFCSIYNELFSELLKERKKRKEDVDKICLKCGNNHNEAGNLCAQCFLLVGLDSQLKKIDLKMSSFWENLSVFSDSMQPIDVAKNFRMGAGVEDACSVPTLHENELPNKKIVHGFDTEVLYKIQLHYSSVVKRMLAKYSKERIIQSQRIFSVLVVCLKLSNNDHLAKHFIEEYCLQQCSKKWHKQQV